MPVEKLTPAERIAIKQAEASGVNPALDTELPADRVEQTMRKQVSGYAKRRGLVARAVQTIGRAFRGNNRGSN